MSRVGWMTQPLCARGETTLLGPRVSVPRRESIVSSARESLQRYEGSGTIWRVSRRLGEIIAPSLGVMTSTGARDCPRGGCHSTG